MRENVRVLVLRPGATEAAIETVKNDIEEFQKLVGGYVEDLPQVPGTSLWVNEDGNRLQLPANPLATARDRYHRPIRGTAVLIRHDRGGELIDFDAGN
jgi:hypothetical protein